jgi:hypothetical protein
MSELRKARRVRAYLGAKAIFNRHASIMDCLVRDLTEEGARLNFAGSVFLPDEIDLEIVNHGAPRAATIVWRNETQAGIKFHAP